MPAAFDDRGPALTEAEVNAFEATLPAPLPSSYRTFLLEQNGGRTLLWWPPEVSGVDLEIRVMYSLGDVEASQSLSKVRQAYLDTLPGVFLAVGSDQGGAQICISLQQQDYGAVWFYDPELEYDPSEPPDPDLLLPICTSFDVLLATMEPEPDFDEVDRRIAAARKAPPRS